MPDWTATVAGVSPSTPDPAPGLARLQAVITTAEAATETAEAVRAVADLIASPDALRELAVSTRLDGAAVTALLMRLGAIKGLRPRVAVLERAICARAERQAKVETRGAPSPRYQMALGQAAAGTVTEDLTRCLGKHALPPGLRCPMGWALSPGGLFRVRVDGDTDETELVEISPPHLAAVARSSRAACATSRTTRSTWCSAGPPPAPAGATPPCRGSRSPTRDSSSPWRTGTRP